MMRYDRAVGKQVQLGYMPLRSVGRTKPPAPRIASWTDNFWNAGINVAYRGSGGDTDRKAPKRKRSWLFGAEPVGVEAFNRAHTQMQYGNVGAARHELGDLFNDIMGAVVPGWDQRSEELKKIKVRLDPKKVYDQVVKVVSPSQASRAAEVLQNAGVSVDYRGQPLTPNAVYAAYQAGGVGAAMSAVPTWVWLAGAGGVVLLFVMSRR